MASRWTLPSIRRASGAVDRLLTEVLLAKVDKIDLFQVLLTAAINKYRSVLLVHCLH